MVDPRGADPVEGDQTIRQREEPDVVPAISAEQPSIAAGIGVGAYVGRTEEREDNDQQSHVRPTDNDGETVPRDEVVDQVGG